MPVEKGKERDGAPFQDFASTVPERFAVKPVPGGGPHPALPERAIYINRTRYGPVEVNGARNISGILNGKVEDVLLVSRPVKT